MASAEWRALMGFWAGIVGLGTTGAAALEVMGPLPTPAPAAAGTTADALPIALPAAPSGGSLWPALASPAPSSPAEPRPTAASRPPAPAPRPVSRGPVRITVLPPMPPEPAPDKRRTHAPGPRAYARMELRPHRATAPSRDTAVSYSYAEQEPAYRPDYAPPSYGGWGWSGPRYYANAPYGGQSYGYYPPYR